MAKEKLIAARELIREKRYTEARALLHTIDHPKAAEWLATLDRIAPEDVPDPDWAQAEADSLPDLAGPAPVTRRQPRERRPRAGCVTQLTCGCYGILLVGFLLWLGFGVLVSLGVREIVQTAGESLAQGTVTTTVEDQLENAGIDNLNLDRTVDDFAQFIVDGLNDLGVETNTTNTGQQVAEASQTAATTAMALTFLSLFLCPVLPVFILTLLGFLRSFGALRR